MYVNTTIYLCSNIHTYVCACTLAPKGLVLILKCDYIDYIKYCDVLFTIVKLMLVCYNCDSYSSFKDP